MTSLDTFGSSAIRRKGLNASSSQNSHWSEGIEGLHSDELPPDIEESVVFEFVPGGNVPN